MNEGGGQLTEAPVTIATLFSDRGMFPFLNADHTFAMRGPEIKRGRSVVLQVGNRPHTIPGPTCHVAQDPSTKLVISCVVPCIG